MKLDRTKKMPVYIQLKHEIKENINNKDFPEEECLPSERELCDKYGVSRMTIRQAIGELVNEGILYRLQGRGTFITNKKIVQPLSKITSFTQDMESRNLRPGSRILSVETFPASKFLSTKLKVDLGSDIVMIKRLRLADNKPISIETMYIGKKIGEMINENEIPDSMYFFLKETLGYKLHRAIQSIEASTIEGWEASLLNVEDKSLVLFMQRQTFGENDNPIEYTESKYRADLYKFNIELTGI